MKRNTIVIAIVILAGLFFMWRYYYPPVEKPFEYSEENIPDEWKITASDEVGLLVPETFVNLSTQQNYNLQYISIEKRERDEERKIESDWQDPFGFDIEVIDPQDDLFQEYIFVFKDHLTYKVDLEEYVDYYFNQSNVDIYLTRKQMVNMGGYDAYRVEIEMYNTDVESWMLIYILMDGHDVWYLEGVSALSEYKEWMPVFEESFATLQIR